MAKRLLVLLLLALAKSTNAQSCSSRVFCKTSGVRYMGMQQSSGKYLNTTAIKSAKAANIPGCQTLCIRQDGCFSINIDVSNVNEYGCHLLSTNIYANSTQLVQHKDFIHLYMESPCKRKPCKNDGICIPHYSNDSYSCECKKNTTFIASGKHCESIASGIRSADYYWTFENVNRNHGKYIFDAESGTGFNLSDYKFLSSVKNFILPGRPGRVAYVRPDTKSLLKTRRNNIQCLNTFSGCETGVSYSVWVKTTEKEAKKMATYNIFYTQSKYVHIHFTGHGDRTRGFTFLLVPSNHEKWMLTDFGKHVRRTSWNHFLFTFASDGPLCAYINGVQDKCSSNNSTVSYQTEVTNFWMGLQFDNSRRNELYVDDFAVWRKALSIDDVKNVYRQGKA